MTDEKLISAAALGDEQAFAELLDGEYKRIYRYAYRWCGNVADAEDVTQLACIKLAKNIGQYRGESAFTTWLYRLVVNCAKDWQKSQARHLRNSDAAEEATSQDSNTQWIFLQQVLKLIETMGEDFKETALLVLAEGFSHREAGKMLGVKEGTISWRLHEIRRQLSSLDAKEGQ